MKLDVTQIIIEIEVNMISQLPGSLGDNEYFAGDTANSIESKQSGYRTTHHVAISTSDPTRLNAPAIFLSI